MSNKVSYQDDFMRRFELSVEHTDQLYKQREQKEKPADTDNTTQSEGSTHPPSSQYDLNAKILAEKEALSHVDEDDVSFNELIQLQALNAAYAANVRHKQEKKQADAELLAQAKKVREEAKKKQEELHKELHERQEALHSAEMEERLELQPEPGTHGGHQQHEKMLEALQLEYENSKQQLEKDYELAKELRLEAHLSSAELKERDEALESLELEYELKKLQAEKQKVMQEEATFEANLHLQHMLEGAEKEDEKALEEAHEKKQTADMHYNPTPFKLTPTYIPGSHSGNDGGDE